MLSARLKSLSIIAIVTIFFLYAAHNHAAKSNNNMLLYSHGIADNHTQAYRYAKCYPKNDQEKELFIDYNNLNPLYEYEINKHYLITTPFVTFDYPDAATNKVFRFNPRKSGLAQKLDIEHLAGVFNRTQQKYDKDIILFGVSRGASTIVTFMGQKQPQRVQAIILESPFDAMETVVANKVQQARLHKVPGIKKLSHAIVSGIFMRYHMNGIRPIDLVSDIPKYTPILFVCSEEDTLVPMHSTINLYRELKKKGFPYVHLLIIPEGKHARIINGPHADLYQNVVHAFLKHYHLPHDQQLALAGRAKFKSTRPSTTNIKKLIKQKIS